MGGLLDRTSGGLVDTGQDFGGLGMVAMDQVIKVPCTFLDPAACGGGQAADRLRAQLVHGGLQDWRADLHFWQVFIILHTKSVFTIYSFQDENDCLFAWESARELAWLQ